MGETFLRPNDVRDAHFADNAVLVAKNLLEDAEKRRLGGAKRPIVWFGRRFSCAGAAKNCFSDDSNNQKDKNQEKRDELFWLHSPLCCEFRATECSPEELAVSIAYLPATPPAREPFRSNLSGGGISCRINSGCCRIPLVIRRSPDKITRSPYALAGKSCPPEYINIDVALDGSRAR